MIDIDKPLTPLAEVINLAEFIDCHQGSVVSRTLVDQKTGTITLFAFGKGQGLSEHTAPYDAMVQVLDGEAEVVIAGNPLHLKKGEMVIMPANKSHALRAVESFKMLLIMIRA